MASSLAVAAVLLLAAAPAAGQTGTRRALLVGIEDYPPATGWPQLRGSRADVELMREVLLQRAGVRAQDVTVLLDGLATHAAVTGAFRSLAQASGPDDVLIVYFAGHGSQLPDDDGDEPDGLDETLVPFDAQPPDGPPGDIRDDELAAIIAEANRHTRHVQLYFDCCSSGTVMRGSASGPARRFVGRELRGLAGVRPAGTAGPGTATGTSARDGGSGFYGPRLDYVALSACRADESAWEHALPAADGEASVSHGLFTWCLVQELRALHGSVSCAELADRVRRRVHDEQPNQTPTIEGSGTRAAALGAAQEAQAWVGTLRSADGLGAGLADGLSAGAVLAVLPPGATHDDAAQRLGRVRVVAAGAVDARVEWVDGPVAGSGELAGARCFLLDPGAVPDRARLPIAFPAGLPLAARLNASPLLRSTSADAAELLLERASGRIVVRGSGSDAPLLSASVDSPADCEDLVADLEHLAVARRVREVVRNESSLVLSAEAVLEVLDARGRVVGPVERDDAGQPVVQPGAALGAGVRNTSAVPVHATLLVISPDGTVAVAARTAETEPIAPGATFRSQRLVAEVSMGAGAFYRSEPDCYRWVLTTQPHDLSGLVRPSLVQRVRTRGSSFPAVTRPALALDAWLTLTTDVRVRLP